ncbi:MAG: bifunctional phosphoglucose/phosphomannose isomerase [bacterium]
MRDIITSMPEQMLAAIQLLPSRVTAKKQYNKVMVCGMGGSGISGEILKVLYPTVEIISNKDYTIPRYIDHNTLAIVISYSGNTEETLSNYAILNNRRSGIVIISSGGRLLKKKANTKVKIPGGLPPRGALGYLFTPLPSILYKYGFIPNDPSDKIIDLANFLKHTRKRIELKAKTLAKKFVKKMPIIYANSSTYLPVAKRWQSQLNENAKIIAHINVIPEMNHNEIVGLGRPRALNKSILPVFLNDPKAHVRNKARLVIMSRLIKGFFRGIIEIKPQGNNDIKRVFWTIMLGDFISYYLAKATNIDPLPVKRIDYLKKELSKL